MPAALLDFLMAFEPMDWLTVGLLVFAGAQVWIQARGERLRISERRLDAEEVIDRAFHYVWAEHFRLATLADNLDQRDLVEMAFLGVLRSSDVLPRDSSRLTEAMSELSREAGWLGGVATSVSHEVERAIGVLSASVARFLDTVPTALDPPGKVRYLREHFGSDLEPWETAVRTGVRELAKLLWDAARHNPRAKLERKLRFEDDLDSALGRAAIKAVEARGAETKLTAETRPVLVQQSPSDPFLGPSPIGRSAFTMTTLADKRAEWLYEHFQGITRRSDQLLVLFGLLMVSAIAVRLSPNPSIELPFLKVCAGREMLLGSLIVSAGMSLIGFFGNYDMGEVALNELATELKCEYEALWIVDTNPTLIDYVKYRRPESAAKRGVLSRTTAALLHPIILMSALCCLTFLWGYEVFEQAMSLGEAVVFGLGVPVLCVAWSRGIEYSTRRIKTFAASRRRTRA